MTKRGLSDIITTVLIILIAIAAIILIWVFVGGTIKKAGGGIDSSQLTATLSIPIQSVNINQTSKIVSLDIKREAGAGNVVGVYIALEDINGVVVPFRYNLSLSELQSSAVIPPINYSNTSLGNLSKIAVTPILINDQGQEVKGANEADYMITGLESSNIPIGNQPISCTPFSLQSGTTCNTCNSQGNGYVSNNSLCSSEECQSGSCVALADIPWTQFMVNPYHTGLYPGNGPVTNATSIGWTNPKSVSAGIYSNILAANGVIYVQSTANLFAINITNKNNLWVEQTGSNINVDTTPLLDLSRNVIYVIGQPNIFSINLTASNSPAASVNWEISPGGTDIQNTGEKNAVVEDSSGDIYFSNYNSFFKYAPNGTSIINASGFDRVSAAPILVESQNKIIFYDYSWNLRFLNLTLFPLYIVNGDSNIGSSQLYYSGYIFITDRDAGWPLLKEFSLSGGSSVSNSGFGQGGPSTPAAANGLIYVSNISQPVRQIEAFDANDLSSAVWSYPSITNSVFDASPVISSNGILYIGDTSGEFYALNATNGQLIWSYNTGHDIEAPATIYDGRVFAGTADGYIYSFG